MNHWTLHCGACDKAWPVFTVALGKRDWACVFCGAGGVRVKPPSTIRFTG